MELLYNLPAVDRTPATAKEIIETLHGDDGVVPPDALALPEWRDAVWSKMAGLFDLEQPSKVQVVHTEQDVTSHIGGVPFRGFIDRVSLVLDDAGLVRGTRVEDYKTGRASTARKREMFGDSHGDQGVLYLLALRNRDGRAPDEVSIIYTSDADPQVYNVPVTQSRMKSVEAEFVDTWNTHTKAADDGRYEFKSSGLCGWCPLVTICPEAARARKTARIPMADAAELLQIERAPLDRPASRHTVGESETETVPISATTTIHADKEPTMADHIIYSNRDAKPWEGDIKGDKLVGESASATAVFGLTGWAMEMLATAGMPITKSGIEGTAHLLASVVNQAMLTTSGTSDLQAGFHVRLRGLLHSVIAVEAVPFGQGNDAIRDWHDRAVKRLTVAVAIGADLWNKGVDTSKIDVLGSLGSQASKVA